MKRVLKIVLIVVAVLLIVSVSAYFVKNSKKNNSDSEVDQSVFEQACQESGYIYVGEDQVCSGAYITFSLYEDNKGPEVTCCMGGKVYYEFSLPEGFDNIWNSLENQGECDDNLMDSINQCLPYKCSFYFCPDSTSELERGVVSLEDGTCYYYSETVGEGIELYCKLSANSKSKLISYFENVSLIYEHDSCSVKVSSSQIGQVTNPLEELIDSGECQYQGL